MCVYFGGKKDNEGSSLDLIWENGELCVCVSVCVLFITSSSTMCNCKSCILIVG